MGLIHIDPQTAALDSGDRAAFVIAPHRSSQATIAALSEWAASSQAPIFCTPRDIETLEAEGFGAYRFLKLEGYKEVDFQGGTVEFFPAKPARVRSNLLVVARQVLGNLGFRKTESFHIRIWPDREQPVVILAHDNLDAVELMVLKGAEKPSIVIVLDEKVTQEGIERLAKALRVPVRRRTEVERVETQPSTPSPARLRRRELGLWAANGFR